MKQYHPYNYTTLKESGRSASSMTSEYSQMRKVALGRIARLQKNSLEGYSTKMDAFMGQGFPRIRSLKDNDKLMSALAAVSQFLADPLSLTRGMKRKIKEDINTFQDYFEDPEVLNAGNLREFYDFLEEFRAATKGQMYSSEFVFSVWEASEKSGISKKSLIADIDYWSEHKRDLQDIPERTNKQKISSYQAKRMLAAARKKRR
jgi:hypothetical protein